MFHEHEAEQAAHGVSWCFFFPLHLGIRTTWTMVMHLYRLGHKNEIWSSLSIEIHNVIRGFNEDDISLHTKDA